MATPHAALLILAAPDLEVVQIRAAAVAVDQEGPAFSLPLQHALVAPSGTTWIKRRWSFAGLCKGFAGGFPRIDGCAGFGWRVSGQHLLVDGILVIDGLLAFVLCVLLALGLRPLR
jgi:hypothetical protein